MEIFGNWKKYHKRKFLLHVASPMQWYKKFRIHNNGSLQQAWASSFGKSTLDELKKNNGVLWS